MFNFIGSQDRSVGGNDRRLEKEITREIYREYSKQRGTHLNKIVDR